MPKVEHTVSPIWPHMSVNIHCFYIDIWNKCSFLRNKLI